MTGRPDPVWRVILHGWGGGAEIFAHLEVRAISEAGAIFQAMRRAQHEPTLAAHPWTGFEIGMTRCGNGWPESDGCGQPPYHDGDCDR